MMHDGVPEVSYTYYGDAYPGYTYSNLLTTVVPTMASLTLRLPSIARTTELTWGEHVA